MSSFQELWPVSHGISLDLIFTSSGVNSSTLGMVLERNVHLFTRPCVNAVYRLHAVVIPLLRRADRPLESILLFSL